MRFRWVMRSTKPHFTGSKDHTQTPWEETVDSFDLQNQLHYVGLGSKLSTNEFFVVLYSCDHQKNGEHIYYSQEQTMTRQKKTLKVILFIWWTVTILKIKQKGIFPFLSRSDNFDTHTHKHTHTQKHTHTHTSTFVACL